MSIIARFYVNGLKFGRLGNIALDFLALLSLRVHKNGNLYLCEIFVDRLRGVNSV